MKSKELRSKRIRTTLILALIFVVVMIAALIVTCRFIDHKMLQSNESEAADIAMLMSSHLDISDEEVNHMKGLSFNEMEVDPVNQRMVEMRDGITLNANITNIYVLAPLSDGECLTIQDGEAADFLGYEVGTKLDGMWLLNSKFDENGNFLVAERDNIYRYTVIEDLEQGVMQSKSAVGIGDTTSDAWGTFITGYAPLYTNEGTFVGLLGVDMNMDHYQTMAQLVVTVVCAAVGLLVVLMTILFIFYYIHNERGIKNELYADFYSRMSHDMRTPMNGILGLAELSRDEDNIDVLHQNFSEVEQSGKFLLSLINDTLDISRINSGKLSIEPKPVRCGQMISNVVDMIQISADKKDIHLIVEKNNLNEEEYVYIDQIRMKQVISNILSNAVKFTPKGGTITFRMDGTGCQNHVNSYKCTITDSGVGMSEEFVEKKLFHAYEQENNPQSSLYTGSGLGMYITRQIVEMLGGRIEVKSELGKGTTFTVYMNAEKVDEQEVKALKIADSAKKVHQNETLEGKKILLCEDHPLNAEIAARLLERVKCSTTLATDGEKAVALFGASQLHEYDAIIMDIRMPVMDGLEAAKVIRGLDREDAKTIPIIAMSANAYEEDADKSMAAGMNAHLSKPIEPTVMYETLVNNINRSHNSGC